MSDERFIRLQWDRVSPRTGQPQGVFAALWIVERSGVLTEAETRRVAALREWFEANVPNPPGYEAGNTRGAVTWFKSSAHAAAAGRGDDRGMAPACAASWSSSWWCWSWRSASAS